MNTNNPQTQKLPMSLSEFAKGNHAVKLHSKLLGEDYWLVSSHQIQVPPDDAVVYDVSEIQLLRPLKEEPEVLKRIHRIKKRFGATVIEVRKSVKNHAINDVHIQRILYPVMIL